MKDSGASIYRAACLALIAGERMTADREFLFLLFPSSRSPWMIGGGEVIDDFLLPLAYHTDYRIIDLLLSRLMIIFAKKRLRA